MKTADFTLPSGVRTLLADLGLSTANVLRRASLPADLLGGDSVTLRPAEYFAFFEALEAEAGDPNLPIAIGRAISIEAFDPSLFAALCSPNLLVAAERISLYKGLIGPLRLAITQDADGQTLTCEWPPPHRPPALLELSELIFWVALARIATRTEVRPVAVTAPQPPADGRAYEEYLGVRVTEGDRPSVSFSSLDARRPFLTADQATWDFFEPELRRRLSELDSSAPAEERTRAALIELLPAGRTTIQEVATELVVSPRTLQRRLEDEGTSFKAVLGKTREDLARHYLTDGRLSPGEVSFLLGYKDPNSFYRAFHAWTGQTPGGVVRDTAVSG
jgi:AraC-like DNA-binding protein